MAEFHPFKAVRPAAVLAKKVAALPYDVMNSQEAREMAKGNPYSFLHVDKAEIDLDESIDLYDTKVYKKAAENMKKMEEHSIYLQDEKACYYVYRQVMNGRSQTGIVGCASIDDYLNGHVKKHELTREEKEADRIRHVDACNANTGPIFLTCRSSEKLSSLMYDWMEAHAPVYDFTAEDGVLHTVWVIDWEQTIAQLEEAMGVAGDFYIADGHHRAASAVKVGLKRRKEHPNYTGKEEFNYFLSVVFPHDQLKILDYNRVVKDLKGMSGEEFLEKVRADFAVEACRERYAPKEKHSFGMYLEGTWYRLTARQGSFCAEDPVEQLDVSILQNNLLHPILGIGDPRTDKRIEFVGGIRGLQELVRMVDEGSAAAFAMYPTTVQELMDIADQGKLMPPKSTWFEPKLRSGLFIHKLEE